MARECVNSKIPIDHEHQLNLELAFINHTHGRQLSIEYLFIAIF